MEQCNCITLYSKYEDEQISIGDVVCLNADDNLVMRAYNDDRFKIFKMDNIEVVGICEDVTDNQVSVRNTGVTDVNVTGIVCIGDKLTASKQKGKAKAIPYVTEDERIFGIRSIGKVIGVYQSYSKAKVLLDIE